jgi:diguanylate cyclase (GGDEF)-like protein
MDTVDPADTWSDVSHHWSSARMHRPDHTVARNEAGTLEVPGESLAVTSEDVAMRQILLAMVAFGLLVGLAFPAVVSHTLVMRPGGERWFRAACLGAGLMVSAFAYGVARVTLYRTNQRLAQLARLDMVTGLANQRRFVSVLRAELSRGRRLGHPVSLVIADLDHFKTINDTHGHLVGNQALASVAHSMRAGIRPYDLACRIGGEEFAVVLPATTKDTAAEIADRLRVAIAGTDDGHLPPLTVSLGVATFPEDADSINLLIKRADDAMYEAKRLGRDAVARWPFSAELPALQHAAIYRDSFGTDVSIGRG